MKRTQLKRSQKPISKKSAKKLVEDKQRKQLKKAVIERDGVWCKRCKGAEAQLWPLDLHELISRGSGGKATLDNCVLLCRWCHRAVTDHACADWRIWAVVKKESV